MHCFGVAADVICGVHQWDCHRNFCRFFETLGDCAEDNGLTWGGNWDRDQKPGEKGILYDIPEATIQVIESGLMQGTSSQK